MPTVKISDLTSLTAAPDNADYVVVVDSSVGETKKQLISDFFQSPTIPALTVTTSATFSGATVADGGTITTVDINGGTIDGTVIGGTTPAAGSFSTVNIDGGTIDGTVIGGTTAAAGSFSTLTYGGTTLTATAAELNVLDGVTASTSEINLLSGMTTTATELNYVAGVTSAIQDQIDTKAPTASPQFSGVSLFNTGSQPAAGVDGVSIEGDANPRMKMGFASNLGIFLQFYGSSAAVGSISTSGGSTTYSTTSDYRVKENVVEMTGAVDRVKSLNPVRFNFIGEQNTVDGFLAHEVQSIVPESVQGDKDAVDENGEAILQGIDQSKLVPVLVAAIKELTARIEALEAGA